jgi:hypothetical protein
MQLFIDVVDTQLLEVILLKVFESKDIKQSNRLCSVLKTVFFDLFRLDSDIHSLDQPVEQVIVDLL